VLQQIRPHEPQRRLEDRDDDAQLAAVEAVLGRKLTAAERTLVWHLRRQGKNTGDITAVFQKATPRNSPRLPMGTRLDGLARVVRAVGGNTGPGGLAAAVQIALFLRDRDLIAGKYHER
jgi:hypothetical protein